jgi:hypothetical protein
MPYASVSPKHVGTVYYRPVLGPQSDAPYHNKSIHHYTNQLKSTADEWYPGQKAWQGLGSAVQALKITFAIA